MAVEKRNRRPQRGPVLAAILVTLLLALFLASGIQQDSPGTRYTFLEDNYAGVLMVTVLALLVLLWAIAHRLITLLRQVRAEEPGARLAARWVGNFLVLSQ